MIKYSGSLPTPSKFQKGDIYHSDYESDWDASPIPPKWRPCHSDTEDLGPSMKYRSVKPKLKPGKKTIGSGKPQPSPPCPHQWESHEDIARLETYLREGRRLRSTSQPATVRPQMHARCHSTPPVKVLESRSTTNTISTSTNIVQEVRKTIVPRPSSTQPQSTPPVEALDTRDTTKTTSTTANKKKEFVSVKKRARQLENIMTSPPPQVASSDDLPGGETPPSTERGTPIKPEDIPGAVRVFPVPMMSTSTASGNHWKRSASVDMNGHCGGGGSAGGSARNSPMTLPRATKHFRLQSHHTNIQEPAAMMPIPTPPSPPPSSSSSRKFQVAINSSTTTSLDSYSTEEKERKTTLKQSCIITDDLPPTIELIAYKCEDGGSGGSNGNAGGGGDASRGSREGHQISGYEADTDDTLNSREMKKLFKPSKFVPKLTSPSVWKPSATTLS